MQLDVGWYQQSRQILAFTEKLDIGKKDGCHPDQNRDGCHKIYGRGFNYNASSHNRRSTMAIKKSSFVTLDYVHLSKFQMFAFWEHKSDNKKTIGLPRKEPFHQLIPFYLVVSLSSSVFLLSSL